MIRSTSLSEDGRGGDDDGDDDNDEAVFMITTNDLGKISSKHKLHNKR